MASVKIVAAAAIDIPHLSFSVWSIIPQLLQLHASVFTEDSALPL
jgi:hypothetical protein